MPVARFPFSVKYDTRIASINMISTASGVVGIGIVGTMIVGNATQASDKDGRNINCFSQTISENEKFTIKRPGFGSFTTPQASSIGNAILVWTGQGSGDKVISSFGATNSSIYDGTTQLVTNAADTTKITGKATGITETLISNVATLVISSSDNTAWTYQNGGTVTKIADADFPGNAGQTLAGTFAHMDGFACIMDTNAQLWASDLNSATAWTSTSFDTANAYPDRGIGAVRFKNYIMAFGTNSVQFFYNAGLTPFPFAKAVQMTQQIGAVSAAAIATISDYVFFCGATPQGGTSIFRYDGSLTRISTPEIDAMLVLAGASNITLTTIRFYGRSFVIVIASNATYVYCIEEKEWHEWFSDAIYWHKCVGLSTGANIVSYAISQTNSTGKVFIINPANLTFQDNGYSYSAVMQLQESDYGTNRLKVFNVLDIECDKATSTSNLTVSYSDDDYQNFTTWGTLDLSIIPVRAAGLGAARRRAWSFSHTDNVPLRLRNAELTFTVGVQ